MKAFIAMSGGIDSSVSASLMQEQGFDCMGGMLILHPCSDSLRPSGSNQDLEDAKQVADSLHIPFTSFDMQKEFQDKVISSFVHAYLEGKTPNPCIKCNQSMKFGLLLEKAIELGCDKLVTGHYAQIEERDGVYYLKRAFDSEKDQSYVLYFLNQYQLSHLSFPLGTYQKSQIRAYAEVHGFVNAKKKESQDICFVPDGDYAKIVESYSGPCPTGNFVDRDGKVLGKHKGIIHYTIGQHKGLGLSFKEKNYVCSIDPLKQTVLLAPLDYLFKKTFQLSDINWISGKVPTEPLHCDVMLRYRKNPVPAIIYPTSPSTATVELQEAQRAITPGQACVFYEGEYVLGGGTIQ